MLNSNNVDQESQLSVAFLFYRDALTGFFSPTRESWSEKRDGKGDREFVAVSVALIITPAKSSVDSDATLTLVPQLTIVTPPKPKFHYFVACLPIVPSSWQGV